MSFLEKSCSKNLKPIEKRLQVYSSLYTKIAEEATTLLNMNSAAVL